LRFMGLDVGEVRIGVAVSDELGLVARALDTIERTGGKRDFETVLKLVGTHDVEHIVVGYPLNLDGSIGSQAERITEFRERLGTLTPIEVSLWDERFSSQSAERVLIESGMQRRKRKYTIDKVAAVVILQHFLDHRNSAASKAPQSLDEHGE